MDKPVAYDHTSPAAIYDYSKWLVGHTLRDLLGDKVIERAKKGKGRLGQMVEELFFNYKVNSDRHADFREAGVELKCTPLLRVSDDSGYRIKERLVCSMIDYHEIVYTPFDDSHLAEKCRLMLLLFYLHVKGEAVYDFQFIYRVLWALPEKDLILIRRDYETIADKVRKGEAHLLSEGDTLYLGACRKGQKGDALQAQPYSEIGAKKRAFSLKPAYMRYVLGHVTDCGEDHYTNYTTPAGGTFELVSHQDLQSESFEDIIIRRFGPFRGLDYIEICDKLGFEPYQAKSKYADIAGIIASDGKGKRLSEAEEFIKSGIILKTVRLTANGMPKESMSFKNIDYYEVAENDEWPESDLYELFTSRFMFVVFRSVPGRTITVHNNSTGRDVVEPTYVLDDVFFWTMPQSDLENAREYWENIRQAVLDNNIRPEAFWSISSHRDFHVRPKAAKKIQKARNPHGGMCDKYCYWFNADYVKTVIERHKK